MPVTALNKAERFALICERLKEAPPVSSFDAACYLFATIFRQVEMEHQGAYSQDRGQCGNHLYFYEFSQTSPFWQKKKAPYILEGNKHYTVFDDRGNFVIYSRSGTLFENIVLSKSTNDIIKSYVTRKLRDL